MKLFPWQNSGCCRKDSEWKGFLTRSFSFAFAAFCECLSTEAQPAVALGLLPPSPQAVLDTEFGVAWAQDRLPAVGGCSLVGKVDEEADTQSR